MSSKFISSCRKIIGIGRNFAEHAKELGHPIPTEPIIFLKPPSSIITSPGKVEIPKGCDVHHEIELGVVIGKGGRNIKAKDAMNHIAGYTLALDMTARNLQNQARKNGDPWAICKGYDTFTALGAFIDKAAIPNPTNLQLKLNVDQKTTQNGNTKDMIFDLPFLIEYISKIMKLEPNDLILTGTPSGVGSVLVGQVMKGSLCHQGKELSRIEFLAVKRE